VIYLNKKKKTALVCILIVAIGILAAALNIFAARSKSAPEDGIMVKGIDIYEW
jgi:hypothetical protein